jgi:hypothetical protein
VIETIFPLSVKNGVKIEERQPILKLNVIVHKAKNELKTYKDTCLSKEFLDPNLFPNIPNPNQNHCTLFFSNFELFVRRKSRHDFLIKEEAILNFGKSVGDIIGSQGEKKKICSKHIIGSK